MRSLLFLALVLVLLIPVIANAQWQTDGAPICVQTGTQQSTVMVSDGAGGAIVVWMDGRNGSFDVYAQRVNGAGVAQWTTNGIAITTLAGSDFSPTIASDGAGGAIITWQHLSVNSSIYAQRVNAVGAAQWVTNGVIVCSAAGPQERPQITADGAGGAIMTWEDSRVVLYDIYAQKVNASGTPQWTTDGVAISTAQDQTVPQPQIVSDGAGGAIICWQHVPSIGDKNIFAQRIDTAGVTQWTANGIAVCTKSGIQDHSTLVADGAGGAIIAWEDQGYAPTAWDIYAQRVDASGAALWNVNGNPVCNESHDQLSPSITSDGAGGAIVSWKDDRSGSGSDAYAQRINSLGLTPWTLHGVALSTSAAADFPRLATDGSGGAIVVWEDARNGSTNHDIYARRVNSSGTAQWTAGGVPVCNAAANQTFPWVVSDGAGGAIMAWPDIRAGNADIYASRLSSGGLVPTGVLDTPSISALSLTPNYPNPFLSRTSMSLDLPAAEEVEMEVFDVAGRRVRHADVGEMNAGWNEINFDGRDDRGALLPSGVYFYRVHAGSETVTEKMVIER